MKCHPTIGNVRRTLLCSALAMVLAATGAHAQVRTEPRAFDVPAQPAGAALNAFATQADITLVFSQDAVSGAALKPLQGRYTTQDGLDAMLDGTGLSWQAVDHGTISITRRGDDGTSGRERDAQNLQTVTVTGTRIRGGSAPSPVITIGAERIQEEGFTDLGQVMRSVPQNYNGGQNPGVTAGAAGGGFHNQNVTGGSTANLRGLGQDGTLTLLNGRRMSYGGYDQAVDISAIPVEAVERMEIVTDGASAIYGSDAVGGVVNVMLKRDFDGVALGARYGEATDGGLTTREYTATAGTTWPTGGFIATLKKGSNDPIHSHQRDYTRDVFVDTTLYQGSDVRSALLSGYQALGGSVELQLDALRNERDSFTGFGYEAVYYRYPTETTTSLVAPSVVVSLRNDWTLNASVAAGRDKTDFRAIGTTRATGAISLNRTFSYGNESFAYEIGGEGPLFALPAGDARLAVGLGARDNDFLYLYEGREAANGDESSRFAYAEVNLPLVAPGQNVRGIHRLGLTGAVRAEDHDSYGRVTTPKIGVIYSPSADFTLKTSWGESFKAPTLYQRYIGAGAYLYPGSTFGGAPETAVLYVNGGTPDLEPERARTWSASLAFHPEAWPGLEAELTWFSVEYTERIVQPIITTSQALVDPAFAQFVAYDPSPEVQAALIDSVFELANYTGAPYDPDRLLAIIDNRFVNASQQRVNGVDLSGAYRMDLAAGRLTFRGAISWLDSERALTTTSGYAPASDILFFPARISGRGGAVWNRDGFTASLFANYKSGVTNTVDGIRSASFTSFDGTLRYDTGAGEGLFADSAVELSMQNLLDRAPPLYATTALQNAPYDSTNYPAIGRYLSLSISKRW